MTKESVEVFAIAIGVVIFLERGWKEERRALGPVVFLRTA
jgi:hypothetical protein